MARRITKKTGKASGLGQLIIPLTALGILFWQRNQKRIVIQGG